ncbi:MAG: SH3 domain-containing protein [Lachnospiraceae bacterium]|nr:SH3 domain-containing protein [Lachnospiraceae bacterium]
MLTYTYTNMDATMYAQKTVNIRSMPNADGEKSGSLSTNDEVKVTGQCTETSWYRIEYNGNAAYVSDDYLGNDKVVVEQPKAEQPKTEAPTKNSLTANTNFNSYAEARAYAISSGYPIGQAVYNGNGSAYCYCIGHPDSPTYGEDSAFHSADIDSARRCADSIFGFGTNYQSVTENGGTHVEKFGNGWTVYRFTYIPTYPKVPTSDYTDFPYELYTLYDNGTYFYFYTLENDGIIKPGYWYDIINECEIANAHRFATYDEWGAVRPTSEWADSGYRLKGEKVMLEARFSTKEQLQNRGLWTE